MIYDAIERELDLMCQELNIEIPSINLSNVRICPICEKPFIPNCGQKYCKRCAHQQNKKTSREYYQHNKDRVRAKQKNLIKQYGLCTCCGQHPIAPGNRFLCNLCFTWDGDGWKAYHAPKKGGERDQ